MIKRYFTEVVACVIMSFIIYQIYINLNDFKYTIAFLGGAVTILVTQYIDKRMGG